MKKDRVAAFTDAVLAIIMTILVLELKKPESLTMLLLFFCLMIPYATDLVSGDFNNKLAQGFYGILVIMVTLANIGLSVVLQNENKETEKPVEIMKKRRLLLWIDVGVKVIGLVTALTVYPPAMMFSVIIAAGLLMGGIRVMRLDWDHMQ